jgi:hypothetical protein
MHPVRRYVVSRMLACLSEFASYSHAADNLDLVLRNNVANSGKK